jgi:uncharacterized protein YndB with AHSA1/START domain
MPRTRSFAHQVEIDAPPADVWRALTDSDLLRRWLGGAEVRSTWRPGDPISFEGVLAGTAYHDRGTVVEAHPGRLLRYDHWSELSRGPDTPEARSLITFELSPANGGTRLTMTHERLERGTSEKHARFFWGVALHALKELVPSLTRS